MGDEDIVQFRQALRGRLITPGDPDYDEARALYNGMIDKRPALIAQCVDVADVVAAVNFGRDNGLLVAIRGGGHNGPGLGSVDDGLVIDLSMMKGVRVDPASQTVRVGPGCTSGDVDHATHAFGLAVPFGIVSTTGVAGLTLGGGSGYLTRKHGLTIDNLLEADVVLADGSFVTASAKDNPDLFWALRGGGGNFGVVTSFLFQAHPVKIVYAGPIFWDAKYGKEIMAAYRDFLPDRPGGARHLRRPEDGALDGPVSARGLGQARLRDHRQLQRLRGGRQEGARAAARQAARALLQLDEHHALPGDAGAVRPVLPEGAAVVLEGRLRDGPAPTRRSTVYIAESAKAPSELCLMHLYPIDGAVHRVGSDETAWGSAGREVVDGDRRDQLQPAAGRGADALGPRLLGCGAQVQSGRRLRQLHDGR